MTDVTATGPVFNGEGEKILNEFREHLGDAVAQEGVNMVHDRLHGVLKHPTGRYESKIQTERQVDDVSVNDSGIIYGPWLESIGSRNYPVTRFRGYATFRKTTDVLDRSVPDIADREWPAYGARLNA